MLYKNCRELPYHNFNEIQVEGDLTYLVKDKEKHDDIELQKHWDFIIEEYFDLTNDFSQKKFFRDKAELNYLQLKLTVMEKSKYLLTLDLDKDNRDALNEMLKNYKVADLDNDILSVKDDIHLKLNRFKSAYNVENTGTFEDMLASMRMNGIQVNRHEITVSEWVSLLKQAQKQATRKNSNKKQ